MTAYEELYEIANKLDVCVKNGSERKITEPMSALEKSANEVARSFSGSWLGYHSLVYYEDLKPVPAGANFSAEWGLKDLSFTSLGSVGNWAQYEYSSLIQYIEQQAGNPDLGEARNRVTLVVKTFEYSKYAITSILDSETDLASDTFILRLKAEIDKLNTLTKRDIVNKWSPSRTIMTRDSLALGQGIKVPPHIEILAEISSIRSSFLSCQFASDIARRAASHLERKAGRASAVKRIGTNVFIGHGRSNLWRELKDFVQDRMALPWDEFNRVPVAGITNISRLLEMLDSAAIAFLVMTAEDEMADGNSQARMNVIHEAGLFQGRLGFTKAIILLEEGCTEFSNIQGLGQIRFPKGNIASAFEEIRLVLEREGLV